MPKRAAAVKASKAITLQSTLPKRAAKKFVSGAKPVKKTSAKKATVKKAAKPIMKEKEPWLQKFECHPTKDVTISSVSDVVTRLEPSSPWFLISVHNSNLLSHLTACAVELKEDFLLMAIKTDKKKHFFAYFTFLEPGRYTIRVDDKDKPSQVLLSGWYALAQPDDYLHVSAYFGSAGSYSQKVAEFNPNSILNFKLHPRNKHLEIFQIAIGDKDTNIKVFEKSE